MLTETRLGRPMDDALADMAERVGSNNLSFVVTAVTIQRQVGGSLAGIFDMVADAVRNRQQFARKIRGLTAMGRMSAYVLVGVPFFMAGTITLLNTDYMRPLFQTGTGQKLLARRPRHDRHRARSCSAKSSTLRADHRCRCSSSPHSYSLLPPISSARLSPIRAATRRDAVRRAATYGRVRAAGAGLERLHFRQRVLASGDGLPRALSRFG